MFLGKQDPNNGGP